MIEGWDYEVVNKVPMSFSRAPFDDDLRLFVINQKHEWDAFFGLLMQQKVVACDTETEGFHWFKGDRICGISMGWGNWHFYIPLRHKPSVLNPVVGPQLSIDLIKEDLQVFFRRKDVFTVWFNQKFDKKFFRADGVEVATPFHEASVQWNIYDENAPGKLKIIASGWRDELGRWRKGVVHKDAKKWDKALDEWRAEEAKARRKVFRDLVMGKADELQQDLEFQGWKRTDIKKYVRSQVLHDHEFAHAKKQDVDYSYVPIELMTKYACLDTYLTMKVHEYCSAKIKWTKKTRSLYINELKLSDAIMEAEWKGVKVDRKYLEELGDILREELRDLEQSIFDDLKVSYLNLNSTTQLSQALIDSGVKLTVKTSDKKKKKSLSDKASKEGEKPKKDNWCLDKQVLADLAEKYEVCNKIKLYRSKTKLLGTYVESILAKLTDDDILHCSFNQNVATGRMSSSDPNLQNIPGRDDRIRRAFIVPDDYDYLFVDYSQVEVRLTAHFSEDPLLLEAYRLGQDIHTRTMCEMFGMDYGESMHVLSSPDGCPERHKELKLLRNVAKIVNFGIIYGISAFGLAVQIQRPKRYERQSKEEWVRTCQDFVDTYLRKYLGVARMVNRTSRFIKRHSYVENFFGRVRNLPHAQACRILRDSDLGWLEGRAKRQGVNFLVQGTAADAFKIAIVRVHKLLEGTNSSIVNFVHDEIQIYLHKDERYLLPKIKEEMERFPEFRVPLIADFEKSSTNWADKEEMSEEEVAKAAA